MQKHVNLVDLVKSFPTNIYLQNLASIQKRTSLVKFAHLAEKSGKGSISNLSTKVELDDSPSDPCPDRLTVRWATGKSLPAYPFTTVPAPVPITQGASLSLFVRQHLGGINASAKGMSLSPYVLHETCDFAVVTAAPRRARVHLLIVCKNDLTAGAHARLASYCEWLTDQLAKQAAGKPACLRRFLVGQKRDLTHVLSCDLQGVESVEQAHRYLMLSPLEGQRAPSTAPRCPQCGENLDALPLRPLLDHLAHCGEAAPRDTRSAEQARKDRWKRARAPRESCDQQIVVGADRRSSGLRDCKNIFAPAPRAHATEGAKGAKEGLVAMGFPPEKVDVALAHAGSVSAALDLLLV